MKNIVLLFIFISASLLAQNDRHEKIKALKTAHITEALELSPNEAEKFWPIYNEYETKMVALRKSERSEIIAVFKEKGIGTLSEKEANSLLDRSMEIRTQEVAKENLFVMELKKVLPPQKILMLRKAEDDFKRKLLHRMRQRKDKK